MQSIGLFGFGKSTQALIAYLAGRASARPYALTLRSETAISPQMLPSGIRILTGKAAFLPPFEDILYCSPSVRRERNEFEPMRRAGVAFSSEAELFFSRCFGDVFAVTGSDGKSTTASMISALLTAAGKANFFGGNIGKPLISLFSEKMPYHYTVAELSSFQLQYFTPPTRRAVVTNLTENHLNWHSSFAEYAASKGHLYAGTKEAILNADDAGCFSLLSEKAPYAVFSLKKSADALRSIFPESVLFSEENGYLCRNGKRFCPTSNLALPERHNIANFLTACATVDGFVPTESMAEVGKSFRRLPHRAETIAECRGVTYIDASIDSTPARTAVTLTSLNDRIVLILGGAGKNLSFDPLIQPIFNHAKAVICTGQCGEAILDALLSAGIRLPGGYFSDFGEAVHEAIHLAEPGDAVLLSPAATSYDAFRNYAERGEAFRRIVESVLKSCES